MSAPQLMFRPLDGNDLDAVDTLEKAAFIDNPSYAATREKVKASRNVARHVHEI
jgi:hypothetical protein